VRHKTDKKNENVNLDTKRILFIRKEMKKKEIEAMFF
jgi:hypothetical protein